MKKIFLLSLSFISVHACHASVMFSEIMYDLDGTDTDREWVEIYNGGSDSIDLSTWKFFEGNTNHSLVPVDGSGTLAANTYAVIADKPDTFRIDWPNYSGLLFDSSFSLTNDPGETLSLKDASLAVIDTITYTNTSGAQGDGNSLQKMNSILISAAPTPGAVNSAGDSGGGDSSLADSSGSIAPAPKIIESTVSKIQTDIIVPQTIFSGISFQCKTKTIGFASENRNHGSWIWSFGDGNAIEQKTNDPFSCMYEYPGTYVMTLAYRTNPYLPEPDATDRVLVTVVAPDLVISSLLPDGGVVLKNMSSKEIDVSGWKITRGATVFVFPSTTIFLPNKELTISQKHSHLSTDIPVTLFNPAGDSISIFPTPVVSKFSSGVSSTVRTTSPSSSRVYTPIAPETAEKKDGALLASVAAVPAAKKPWKAVLPFAGFALVSGLGGYTWWRYSRPPKVEDEDDYEIVE